MVFNKAREVEQLQQFIEYLRQYITVQKVILFGSHAYGKPHQWSDIDLAVISPDFAGESMIDRLKFLYQAAWDAGTNWIEPLGYTLEELESADPLSLLSEIRESGIVVYDEESEAISQEAVAVD